MLECGLNFKGSLKPLCQTCLVDDSENHRLNFCIKWRNMNLYDINEKVPFDNVYSNDPTVLKGIIQKIALLWNTRTAHGSMLTV